MHRRLPTNEAQVHIPRSLEIDDFVLTMEGFEARRIQRRAEMDQVVCLEIRAVSYCCKLMAPADHTRMACTFDRDLDVEGVIYPMTLSQAPI